MNILITGANGFIGKQLISALKNQHNVFALVRTPSEIAGVTDISLDLSSNFTSQDLPKGLDTVVHLAQSPHYRDFPQGLQDTLAVNTIATAKLLNVAKETGCENFIFASTGSVYDDLSKTITEESSVAGTNQYSASKIAGEMVTELFKDILNVCILRIFFPFGPTQRNMFLPNVINSINNGGTINIEGTKGGLKFCPIYIDDLTSCINTAIDDKWEGIFNVAGSENHTLLNVSIQIANYLNKELHTNINELGSAPEYSVSLDKLMSNLPRSFEFTSFDRALRATIASNLND